MNRNIELEKQRLRKKYKQWRSSLSPQEKLVRDNELFDKLIATDIYRKTSVILTYLSINGEIDTHRLIEYALSEGKTVAIPVCTASHNLEFYIIQNLDNLILSNYKIEQPDPKICVKITREVGSICIVPALCYDENGYRLGYGGGYYDRFLTNYKGTAIGLCYRENLIGELPHDSYDVKIDVVLS